MQVDYNIPDIKRGLSECLSLVQAPVMKSLDLVIRKSIEKLDEPMQLAIIGKISSSKSTLVNAILGKDELMSTGQKEVTYNVGWLKFGESDSDIIIHYKDNRSPRKTKRSDFEKLSIETNHSDIDNISYIEIFDDSEILKDINIIDTPGLDAKREKDSQNTLDFISKVRPDAVVMLFTHAVAENVLDVVSQFNAGSSFNPLNAIGILSKIDVLWQETIPRDKSALIIGRKMVANRKRKDAMLSKTLFDLYPLSALLFLAATTIKEQDINLIVKAFNADCTAFSKSLNSMPNFLKEPSNPMTELQRMNLANKIGLYGIWLIVQRLKNEESVSVNEIKKLFLQESGAVEFKKSLYNHFGSRAKLIKIESVYQHINQEIQKVRAHVHNNSESTLLANIEQRISDVFASLVHEHKEYRILNKIYSGEMELDDDVADEFKNICGERGNSAPEKLGLPSGTDASELLLYTLNKERYWRREVALEPDPEEREWMNVILKSYANLHQKISAMIFQYEQSKNFLFN